MWLIVAILGLFVLWAKIWYDDVIRQRYTMWNIEQELVEFQSKIDKSDGRTLFALARKLLDDCIYPAMQPFMYQATRYCEQRDEINKKLQKIVRHVKAEILEVDEKNTELLYDASFGAKLNLIGQSDIDIGLLVEDLDEEKRMKYDAMLKQLGYLLGKQRILGMTNIMSMKRKLKSFQIEVKVRDKRKARCMVDLHHYLDTSTNRHRTN